MSSLYYLSSLLITDVRTVAHYLPGHSSQFTASQGDAGMPWLCTHGTTPIILTDSLNPLHSSCIYYPRTSISTHCVRDGGAGEPCYRFVETTHRWCHPCESLQPRFVDTCSKHPLSRKKSSMLKSTMSRGFVGRPFPKLCETTTKRRSRSRRRMWIHCLCL